MKKTLLTYILLLCTRAAYPQVSVEALIDSTQMVVGEQTRLHVTVSVRRGQQVTFSNWKPQDMLASGVEVVEASMVDTIDTGDGFLKITQHVRLTAFEDSLYYIPPQKVKVDGRVYETKSLALKVLTVPVDTLKPEQYFGPEDVQDNPFQWGEWEHVLWMSLLMAALYILCALAWIRLKSGKPVHLRVRIVKRVPPHQRALKTIGEIKDSVGLVDEKTYYTQLTDVLRKYIEERFGFSAMEMTSAEIIERLKADGDKEKLEEMTMLFTTADLVKFAKYTAGVGEKDRNLVSAVDFIYTTKTDDTPVEEKVMPQATEQERQTMRMRLSLKWTIAIMVALQVALMVYVGWLLYDLRG